jgi:hypothetical protein
MSRRYKIERTLSDAELNAYFGLLNSRTTELRQFSRLMLEYKAELVTPYLVKEKKGVLTALSLAWITADVKCVKYREDFRLHRIRLYWCLVSAVLPLAAIMCVLFLGVDQNTGISLISVTSLSFLSTFIYGLIELQSSHHRVQNAESHKIQLAVRIAEEAGPDFTPRVMLWPQSDSEGVIWQYEWSDGQVSASGHYLKYFNTIMPFEAIYLGEYLLHVWAYGMFSGDALTLDAMLRDKGFDSNDLHFGKFMYPLLPTVTDT